jgi:hypothetical protein
MKYLTIASLATILSCNAQKAGELSPGQVPPPVDPRGNCKSQKVVFTKENTLVLQPTPSNPELVDFNIDYGYLNAQFRPEGGIVLSVTPNSGGTGQGVRLSSTRYVQYGKFTARIAASNVPGIVTTMITMSNNHDEIDLEYVGKDAANVQSNIFFKGIPELGSHSGTHDLNGTPSTEFHELTIDWKHNSIEFLIDGVSKRTHKKDGPESLLDKDGEKREAPWFPVEASQFQVSIWDAGVNEWAGGPVVWGGANPSATFEWFEVQCYDDQDQAVAAWPLDGSTPSNVTATVAPTTKTKSTPIPTATLSSSVGLAASLALFVSAASLLF